jgi:transcriptional regulator GlxA family with amidase domain
MSFVPAARHLLRAKDLADARYFEPLDVRDLAAAAGLSPAHFSREFRRTFGESPHAYLLTRRLERAAAMLRTTDRSVADICLSAGWVGRAAHVRPGGPRTCAGSRLAHAPAEQHSARRPSPGARART